MKFVTFSCIFTIIVLVAAGKDFQSPNDGDVGKRHFKMSKVQMLWEKAQKVLDKHQLADLYADLVIHDRAEKQLKKQKAAGEDEDGLLEATTRNAFIDIVEKYHLENFFPTDRPAGRRTKDKPRPNLKDERLQTLLKRAELEGFTDEELDTLHQELSHHQMKLDEFETLKDKYETLQGKTDNSLEDLDSKDSHWKELHQTNMEMKEKHKELRENLKDLHSKTLNPEKARLFKDPRVYQLWAMAKKSNMSAQELQSFKEELTHFAHRIKKHEYVQNQLKKKKMSRGNTIDESDRNIGHEELLEREKTFKKKLEKYEEDLTHRVKRAMKHTEL